MNVHTLTYRLLMTKMLKAYIGKKDSIVSTLVPWMQYSLLPTVGTGHAHGNTDICV